MDLLAGPQPRVEAVEEECQGHPQEQAQQRRDRRAGSSAGRHDESPRVSALGIGVASWSTDSLTLPVPGRFSSPKKSTVSFANALATAAAWSPSEAVAETVSACAW